jgi:hypothetical protein
LTRPVVVLAARRLSLFGFLTSLGLGGFVVARGKTLLRLVVVGNLFVSSEVVAGAVTAVILVSAAVVTTLFVRTVVPLWSIRCTAWSACRGEHLLIHPDLVGVWSSGGLLAVSKPVEQESALLVKNG